MTWAVDYFALAQNFHIVISSDELTGAQTLYHSKRTFMPALGARPCLESLLIGGVVLELKSLKCPQNAPQH